MISHHLLEGPSGLNWGPCRRKGRAMEQVLAGGGIEQLAPIERETVQDRVYRQLRDSLMHGSFDAGQVLVVSDIAKRLTVSSMPVREALARLVSERALEAMPNRRVRVPELAQDRAHDIITARSLIECDLAQRAMARLTSANLRALEALTDAYGAATDPRSKAQLNHTFHFSIYGQAGSLVLLPVVESLWMQAGPFVRVAVQNFGASKAMMPASFQMGIIRALRAGNGSDVAANLDAGIRYVFEQLERATPDIWLPRQSA
jgi:DNA-binding GntR family transcriptional regulator